MTKLFLHTVQSENIFLFFLIFFLFFRLNTLKSLTIFVSLLPLDIRAATAAYPEKKEAVWRHHAVPVAAWRLVMLTLIISVLLASKSAGLHHHWKSVLGAFCFRRATSDLVTSMGWHKSCPLVCVSQDIPLHEGSPKNPVQMALGCLIPGGCHSALQLWIMAGCRLKTTAMCSESALTLAVVSSQQHGSPRGVISSGSAEKRPCCAQ